MQYSEAMKNARLKVVTDYIDSGASTMKFYSGLKPSSVEVDIIEQVLLCELAFIIPCTTTISDGVAYMASLNEQLAIDGGEVSFARIFHEDGTPILDLDVSEITSDLTVGDATIYKGAMIRIVNWTISD